jgi:hypothetical protein
MDFNGYRSGVALCLLALMTPGCSLHRMTVPERVVKNSNGFSSCAEGATLAASRCVYYVPRPRRHHSTLQKCNPAWWIGNADDPVPSDSYRPGRKFRQLTWALRNPCHNFTFYVIGLADKPFVRRGPHPTTVSSPEGGWVWAMNCYKHTRLPFVDLSEGRFEFYFGWRTEGNFGAKLNFRKRLPAGKAGEESRQGSATRS